jgi:hypothetical protein
MTTIMVIAKHSPKDCPALSESAKKVALEFGMKSGELYKKHGFKKVAGWVSCTPPEHIFMLVLDVPTIEAINEFLMEPAVAKWIAAQDKVEIKNAITTEEGMKIVASS